jgi:hypothetical protein
MTTHDVLVARSADARSSAWSSWGAVDPDVIAHALNPAFMGGPTWPNLRQAFVTARRQGQLLVASDGLSDPFANPADGQGNGFGIEFYATTVDPLPAVPGSWLLDLVWQMSQNAAAHGGLAGLLAEQGLLSTELYDVAIPAHARERYVSDAERVAVLVGLGDAAPPASVQGPLGPIRLANLKLLTRSELDFLLEHGASGRHELARRLAAQGWPTVSSLGRPSVA